MQISGSVLTTGSYTPTKTAMRESPGTSLLPKPDASRPSKTVDFSAITPRQLQAYLDEMITSERMSVDDGAALGSSIPGEWYTQQPDVPIDLRSNIRGIMEFARDNGFKPLAAFYAGLMDRMKMMEAQGLPISVVA